MEQGVANRIAIVAGGAGSPGYGIVKALLRNGATVIVPVADSASIQRLRAQISDVEAEKLITEKVQNWDIERLALTDRIILKMALTEMVKFPNIPVKVTIN